jgi:hypothetical protein
MEGVARMWRSVHATHAEDESPPAWSKTFARLPLPRSSVSRSESRFTPVSCGDACAPSPNTHARHLPDRDPFVLFPGNACVSCVHGARRLPFRRVTSHRRRIYSHSRTSEAGSSPCGVRSVAEFRSTSRSCQVVCDMRAKKFRVERLLQGSPSLKRRDDHVVLGKSSVSISCWVASL